MNLRCVPIVIQLLSMRPRQELSKQDLQDLLKKLLHQNGMCLLIYPEGSNTSLLTALAETIHAHEQNLHQKLAEKLEHDSKLSTLPRRLSYIYDDLTIVDDFKKHPQIVKFSKIILQLFSASTERRLNVFTLTANSDLQYNLSCLIINENGYNDSISIARIGNKYYNIKERNPQSRNDLSLQEVFKTSHIDSDELIETFKSEVLPQKIEKNGKIKEIDIKSSCKLLEENDEPDLILKKAKSSMASKQAEHLVHHNSIIDGDNVSLGDKLQIREDTRLINQCSSGIQNNFQPIHQNNHMMSVGMSAEQMYYLYYQQQQSNYYTGKSDGYLNYPQHMHSASLSPTKNQIYKTPVQPIQPTLPVQPINNYYANPNYGLQPQSTSALDNSQNKRYAGRLKFFDDGKNYGFIIMDSDQSDIFVHYDDLQKAGISKQVIKSFKNEMYLQIRFSFKVMEYFGKYKKSRKAVELIIIDDVLSLLPTGYPLPQ